jgi:putative copper export protein
MEIGLQPLRPGSYLVLWTSVSAQDGHVLRGSYLFSVKVRGPGPSLAGVSTGTEQTFPDAVGLLALLSHWIELLTAVSWAGALAFAVLVLGPISQPEADYAARESLRTRTYLKVALPVLLAASVAVMATNAYGVAGNDWGGALSPSTLGGLLAGQYGQLWVARQAVVLVALGATLLRGRPRAPSVALAAAYLYLLAASGHAASSEIGVLPGRTGSFFSVSIAADWLHLLADGVWLGGQVYIAAVLIPALLLRRERVYRQVFLRALDRFSPAAYAAIAAYGISGLFTAKVQIPSWYAYFYSVYGRALIVKMVLIGLMMLVSAFTVYSLRPRLKRAIAAEDDERLTRRLLRWLHVNPVLGAGVLLATSVMFYYPVPVGFGPPGPSQYVVRKAGFTVTLSIRPDRSGPNEITVLLSDRHGHPVQQAHVSVLTTMLDMVMGTGLASLEEKAPGRFAGSTDLGMGGRWRLQVLVYTPSGLSRINVDMRVGA